MSNATHWFGSLGLAWKYALVFGTALFVTLILGFIKMFYDRRMLLKHIARQDEEKAARAHHGSDFMNEKMRGQDEGDLFGIRALEAGFFGGVAQSAPVSRAGSPTGSRPGSPDRKVPIIVHHQPEPIHQQQQQQAGRTRIHTYTPSPQPPSPSILAGHATAMRQMRDYTPRTMSPVSSTMSLDSTKSDKTITHS